LLIPYDWSFDSSLATYTFQLKNGINYKVEIYTTGNLYFPNDSAIKNLLYEISVTPDQSPTCHDTRVSITIVDIVKSILDNGKIIMFICDSSDGKDKGRRKLFECGLKSMVMALKNMIMKYSQMNVITIFHYCLQLNTPTKKLF
jgi:hypothetical protein